VQEPIRVDVEVTGSDSCRVIVAGELDVATAEIVRTVLHGVLGCYRRIVVDLGGLRFCDCWGLSALLAAARTARWLKADLRLRAVPRFLAGVLRLTGTRDAFTIESPADRPRD
jgi:anti-sigma B factor antagonist